MTAVGAGAFVAALPLVGRDREALGITVQPVVPATAVDLRSPAANNSPELAIDPTDSRFVVLASRLDNPYSCSLAVSGDGGRTWLPSRPFPRLPPGADTCYAPEVAFDSQGTLYYLFVGLHGRGNSPVGAYLTTSADRARTFAVPRRVLGPERYMVRMAVDMADGRLHLVWLEAGSPPPLGGFGVPPNPIMSAHSDDQGLTFSKPVQVSDSARQLVVAPSLALGPHHSLSVLYYDLGTDHRDYEGLEGPTWDGKWSLVAATSDDAGEHFRRGVAVDDQIVPPERVILIYTMPPATLAIDSTGQLFAAWTDARNGDWDVLLRRSSDGGGSWTSPERLNDDPVSDGRHQYLPRLSIASDDRVDAVFYDRRNDPANLRNDVYLTSSSDGGRSFARNVRLTVHPSDSRLGPTYPVIPSAIGLKELGSRLALASEDNRAITAWADTHHSSGGSEEDILATEAQFAHPGGGGASLLLASGAGLMGAGLVAFAIGAVRRRRAVHMGASR